MNRSHNVFLGRNDTMLGICEAVGQDLGFNPDWLRIALGIALLFNPLGVVAAYAALGIAVFASRLVAPSKPQRQSVPLAAQVPAAVAVNDADEPVLALAA